MGSRREQYLSMVEVALQGAQSGVRQLTDRPLPPSRSAPRPPPCTDSVNVVEVIEVVTLGGATQAHVRRDWAYSRNGVALREGDGRSRGTSWR